MCVNEEVLRLLQIDHLLMLLMNMAHKYCGAIKSGNALVVHQNIKGIGDARTIHDRCHTLIIQWSKSPHFVLVLSIIELGLINRVNRVVLTLR